MQRFANNVTVALQGALAPGDLVASVVWVGALPDLAPGDFFLLTFVELDADLREVDHEIVKVTARAGGQLTIERGQEGTLARAWPDGTLGQLRMTAASLELLGAHPYDTANPHGVTKAQVELGNADNTADMDKPVSTAQAAAINAREPGYAAGSTAQYRRGDKTWRDFATDVRGAVLTGLSTATNAAATATDTVLAAIGKLQAQITGHAGSTGATHGAATTAVAGFMSSADKTKLDGIAAGAQANAVTSVAGKTGAVTLVSSDVGLGSVDNTSDANKPVSSAQQTAINGREPSIAAGTTAQFWRGDKSWQDLFTQVRAATLTGLSTASSAAVAATDTVLVAIGKLQAALDTKFGQGAEIPSGIDLNTYTTTGWYNQSQNADTTAVGAANYPVTKAGVLRVLTAGTFTYQTYEAYDGTGLWWRAHYNGVWYAWKQIATTDLNVASATKLATARFINGVLFDGTASITVADSTKVAKSGDTMTGPLILPASAAGGATFNIPHGAGPTAPVNGDLWTTTAGVLARINGTTRDLYHSGNLQDVTQTEAETGTATTRRAWSAQRVAQTVNALALSKAGGTLTGAFDVSHTGGVVFRAVDSATSAARGHVFWDSSGFGLLNNAAQWALRNPHGTQNIVVPGTVDAAGFTVGGSPLAAGVSLDAQQNIGTFRTRIGVATVASVAGNFAVGTTYSAAAVGASAGTWRCTSHQVPMIQANGDHYFSVACFQRIA